MDPEITDNFDLNKASTTLESLIINEYYEGELVTNSYSLELKNSTLEVASYATNKITIYIKGEPDSVIVFSGINQVLYNPKLKYIICESSTESTYSSISIDDTGKIFLNNQLPIDQIENSALNIMAENLGLKEFKN